MRNSITVLFALSVVYAVLGNIIVYILLLRRGVHMRSMWAGTPGYLYRICVKEITMVGSRLRRFAFSTNIAVLVGLVLGLGLFVFQRQ